jgi:hypothetical protein
MANARVTGPDAAIVILVAMGMSMDLFSHAQQLELVLEAVPPWLLRVDARGVPILTVM